jgi:hypothetical protein
MFLCSFELGSAALELLVAGVHVDPSAVREFAVRTRDYLLQKRFGLVVFVLLHGAQAGFVRLQ